ncbi:MAG: hypothetical protein M1815_001462 [Lichina confinis]|nr:MAG: hypothetical protein M1815_001462 [Lichina confinis]
MLSSRGFTLPYIIRIFNDKQRKQVWQNFFSKLEKDRREFIHVPRQTKDYARLSLEIKELLWNGRAIRNAFQTAVTLAEFDFASKPNKEGVVTVEEDHLQQVVNMSSNFKKYLNQIHAGDEAKRAKRRQERLDDAEV